MRTPAILLVSAFVLCNLPAFAQSTGDALWAALQKNPPTVPPTETRGDALLALDKWLSVADSETTAPVVAYYQRTIDHALDGLEKRKPKKGVRVYQFYSSSVVVQTPETVFAFDLDQGPNKSLDQTAAEEGVLFRMTPTQIQRLARIVDTAFYTHEHYDHVDFEITRALAAAGKQVVVTQSNKDLWSGQPWAEKLTVLDQTIDKPHQLGTLQVDVLNDFQWNDNEHTGGTPCNAYLITTPDGTGVLCKGDINCGLRFYGWLNVMVGNGRHVDAFVGSPIYWRGADLTTEIDALLKPIWALGHVWEFTHRKAGKAGGATGTYYSNQRMIERAGKFGTAVALSWGESLDIKGRKRRGSGPKRR